MEPERETSRKNLNRDRELTADFSLPSRDGKRGKKGEKRDNGPLKKQGKDNAGKTKGNPLRPIQNPEIEIDAELPAKRLNPGERPERTDTPKKQNRRKSGESNILERFELEHHVKGTEEPIWDFKVANNLDAFGQLPARALIEPELEHERFVKVSALRALYKDLCAKYLSIPPPEQSFNRWLFAQLTTPLTQKKDSFLSEPALAVDMRVLRYEIQRNLPHSRYIKFQCRDSVAKLKEFFEEYHTCALEWLAHFVRLVKFADKDDEIWRQTDRNMLLRMRAEMEQEIKQSKAALAASCEEEGASVETVKAKFVEYVDRLVDLQAMGMNDLVNAMCARLVREALLVIDHLKQYEKKRDTKVKLLKGDEICYAAYGNDQLPISRTHYMKLYTLYMLNSPEDEKAEHFLSCLYVLLRRYQTFFGEVNEGAAMHAAALPRVFQFLKKELGVEQEMFASPLNCYFARFNSAFPDIDIFFGSLGSFFDFRPVTGSFEVGPPYTEEVLYKMALQLDSLLESDQPLSFVVFVPDWRDPISPGLVVLEASKFLRGDFVIKGRSYEYVIGHQHNEIVKKRYWKLPFDTHLYVLQNAAGHEKWPATPEFLQNFKDTLLGNVI